MAIKRATRAGQSITLPLLCDPDYLARRMADNDDHERLFAESLDPSALGVPLDGITKATVRGLSGTQFLEADEAAARACATIGGERRGLCSPRPHDRGHSPRSASPASATAAARSCAGHQRSWGSVRRLYNRIVTWSHLGESQARRPRPRSASLPKQEMRATAADTAAASGITRGRSRNGRGGAPSLCLAGGPASPFVSTGRLAAQWSEGCIARRMGRRWACVLDGMG
jgi:hypothetical protein